MGPRGAWAGVTPGGPLLKKIQCPISQTVSSVGIKRSDAGRFGRALAALGRGFVSAALPRADPRHLPFVLCCSRPSGTFVPLSPTIAWGPSPVPAGPPRGGDCGPCPVVGRGCFSWPKGTL